MRRRFALFDVAGVAAITIFILVVARDFGALRWSRHEMAVEVSANALADGFHEGVAWHGFYLRSAKVGFSRMELRREANGFRVLTHAVFDLNVMRTVRHLVLDLEADLGPGLELRSFEVAVDSDFTRLQATGTVFGDHIQLVLDTGGVEQVTTVPFEHPPSFAFSLRPAFMRESPELGKRFEHEYFDPFSLSRRAITIEYLGTERINVMGEEVTAHHLRQEISGQLLDAWVNELGEVLREELPLGVMAIRETEAEATYGLGRGVSLAADDLIEAAAIPANAVPWDLEDRTEAVYLLDKVALDGFDLDGGRQRFTAESQTRGLLKVVRLSGDSTGSDVATDRLDLAEFLGSEPLLEVNSPPIQSLAAQVAPAGANRQTRAEALINWVHQSLVKTAVISIPSAAEVLRTRTGDCNEHAVLAVALLRAADVPARVVTGITHMEGRFYYHAWLEYWDGAWVAADPTWGQIPADVGHLRFVIGGLERQMDILGLLGNLQVSGVGAADAAAEGGQ